MRSTFFDRPLEYQLLTAKEEWLQGEPIAGKLTIRNMNEEKVVTSTVDVLLAYGNFKKVKAGVENCWEVLHRENIQKDLSLDGNQQLTFEWRFNLPSDAPITDKSGSMFLLFGGEDVLDRGGRLDVPTKMMELLQSFLQTFSTQFQFVQKSPKYKDGWTEVQLDPPIGSREFPNLEHVMCYLRMVDENLELKYRCKIKTLKKDGESMKVRGKSLEIIQTLTTDDYLQTSGFPNRSRFREVIEIALSEAKPTVVF
ncbi:MAG: hypothetical protein EVA80_00825 [Proteobacteria bacterium]|jgi:hypothetical protein|nr:MAG: hypothetical protein EVA80_00825 [Pseudomonadota bacterium]